MPEDGTNVKDDKAVLGLLLESSASLATNSDPRQVLDCILQSVKGIGFDRVRLYLLSENEESMKAVGEVGMGSDFLGMERRVEEDKYMLAVLRDPRPQIYRYEDGEVPTFEEQGGENAVEEWACLPLRLYGKVFGKLSLDNKYSGRPIEKDQLESVALFVSQAAATVYTASLLRQMTRQKELMSLLLEAGDAIAHSKTLQAGLQRLSEMLAFLIPNTHCAVSLLEESGDSFSEKVLVIEAAHPRSFPAEWRLGTGTHVSVDNYPGLEGIFRFPRPTVLRREHAQARETLERIELEFNLTEHIRSLMLVSLKIEERAVGLLSLARLEGPNGADFLKPEIELSASIAAQTTMLIDRMRLHEETDRRERLLRALAAASQHIRAENTVPSLLKAVVRLAADLTECKIAGLCVYRRHLKEVEVSSVYGLPEEQVGKRSDSTHGLIGSVANSGASGVKHSYSDWEQQDSLLRPYLLRTVAAVPLTQPSGEVEAVLFVAEPTGHKRFTRIDLEILERFAAQASIALQTARLMGGEERSLAGLAVLHRISDYIHRTQDMEKMLHAVLTGVTAGYGLAFNRAILMFVDESGRFLIGKMGIGQLEEDEAKDAWASDVMSNLSHFQRYLDRLDESGITETSVGEVALRLRVPLTDPPHDLFSAILDRPVCYTADPAELPSELAEQLRVVSPVLVAPLVGRESVIGLLLADNKFTQAPITEDEKNMIMTFANTAAIAIENARLLRATRDGTEKLLRFYEVSSDLAAVQDPDELLQTLVQRTYDAAKASWVSLLLIDEIALAVRNPVAIGKPALADDAPPIRADGISMGVMKSGMPAVIVDTALESYRINPNMDSSIKAAICLPVDLPGRRIGVMWIHYSEPHHFSHFERTALQLYVNQAGIAYERARRVKRLESMRRAAYGLAATHEVSQLTEQMARSACEILEADSALVWFYDSGRANFIPQKSGFYGIDPTIWERYGNKGPKRRGTSYAIMERGWFAVNDISDDSESHGLGPTSYEFLRELGIRGVQAVALEVGQEKLGVIIAFYKRVRSLGEDQRDAALMFAGHAALSLKKARLLDQVRRAKKAAEAVAKVIVLGHGEATLRSIVNQTQRAMDCDAVVLFEYNQASNKFKHPPTMVGVWNEEKASQSAKLLVGSIVHAMLDRIEPYVAENALDDVQFKNTRFQHEEQIRSCIAVPLLARKGKVGVIFVNYRNQRRFTRDEVNNVKLFARQAAIAIRNAQLFEELERKTANLSTLYKAGRAFAAELGLGRRELLNRIVRQAVQGITSSGGRRAVLGTIQLYDAGTKTLSFESVYPLEEFTNMIARIGERRPLEQEQMEGKRVGVTGRAVLSGRVQLVPNVKEDRDYMEAHPGILSEVAVPLVDQDEVVGVINIESDDLDAFDRDYCDTLQAVADLAVIAISNAQRYEDLRRREEVIISRLAGQSHETASSRAGEGEQALTGTLQDEIKELKRLLSGPILCRYVGSVHVGVTDDSLRRVRLRPYAQVKHSGTVVVWLKPKAGLDSLAKPEPTSPDQLLSEEIDLSDGEECTDVKFEIATYSKTLSFSPRRLIVTASPQVESEEASFSMTESERPEPPEGVHEAWIKVFQANRLIQAVQVLVKFES